MESVLGVWSGGLLRRFFLLRLRSRWARPYRLARWHSNGIDMVLCVRYLAGNIAMLLGLAKCFVVEMRIQCNEALPGRLHKGSCRLYRHFHLWELF